MSTPKRIQLRRTKGWRMPPNTVKVDRSTVHGNPFHVGVEASVSCDSDDGYMDGFTIHLTATNAVELFRDLWETRLARLDSGHPEDLAMENRWREQINALADRNLACWCADDEPCHADVLIDLARTHWSLA